MPLLINNSIWKHDKFSLRVEQLGDEYFSAVLRLIDPESLVLVVAELISIDAISSQLIVDESGLDSRVLRSAPRTSQIESVEPSAPRLSWGRRNTCAPPLEAGRSG